MTVRKITTASKAFTLLGLLCLGLTGCVNQTITSNSVPTIATPSQALPEDLLLDVGIATFDPGLEEIDEDEDIPVFQEVRKAESHFMPAELAKVMQESAAWGAVRVVNDPERTSDLSVRGTILHSDGESIKLHISAHDSRNYRWLDKTYTSRASAYSYKNHARHLQDPFIAVYATIANDLLAAQERLREQDRRNIRLVSELLFAQSFSPEAFNGYIQKNPNGQYLVMRLPAENDPMLARIRTVRSRDHSYIDTMQAHYDGFNETMYPPYQEWRKLTYEEVVRLQELRRESTTKMIVGVIAVAAGLYGSTQCNQDDPAARDACYTGSAMTVGAGGLLVKRGVENRAEMGLHIGAIEEAGLSLEAEITPQVVDLEDRSVTLKGSVDDQYAQWRSLLAEIYATEIGSLENPEALGTSPDTL